MIDTRATHLRHLLDSKQISCVELTQQLLEDGKKNNQQSNAVITWTDELALSQAKKFDSLKAQNNTQHFLAGLPILHKDLFCQRGIKTTCASKILSNWVAPYNSKLVESLEQVGMISLGKTNMDEFAMGSSNETSYFGPVHNPWDTTKIPGGSSGGAAAATAQNMSTLASGTDTGGSIRQPAAHCGVIGIKPTYGRISRWGMIAMASSMDQAGFMGKDCLEIAKALEVVAGNDDRDTSSVNIPVPNYADSLDNNISGTVVGIPEEYIAAISDPVILQQFEEACTTLESLGAVLKTVNLRKTDLSLATYYILMTAEASSNLARYDGIRYGMRSEQSKLQKVYSHSRETGFGLEVKRRICAGAYVLASGYYDDYYVRAQKCRHLIKEDFNASFADCDVLFSPTTPCVAFGIGEKIRDPIQMYKEDILTNATNLAGLPGMSFPIGFSGHLPIGGQLIGKDFSEAKLLNICNKMMQIKPINMDPTK